MRRLFLFSILRGFKPSGHKTPFNKFLNSCIREGQTGYHVHRDGEHTFAFSLHQSSLICATREMREKRGEREKRRREKEETSDKRRQEEREERKREKEREREEERTLCCQYNPRTFSIFVNSRQS